MPSRRCASSAGTNVVWPAASRAFHSSTAAVSSASSSSGGRRPAPGPVGAGSRPLAPRPRLGRPGESPHMIRCPGRARLAGRSFHCLLSSSAAIVTHSGRLPGVRGTTSPPARSPCRRGPPSRARRLPRDASGVWRRPSARSTGCCRSPSATPAGTSRTDLRAGLQAPHRPRRGGRSLVRPGQGRLRPAAGDVLADPQSGHPQPPGLGFRQPVPVGDFLSRRWPAGPSRLQHATRSSDRGGGRSSRRSSRSLGSTRPRSTTSVT